MYTLEEYGDFSLHIYDIRGNLVKKLKTGRGSPGSYKLAWNSKDESGKKVTSGVYICQLKTSEKIHMIKSTINGVKINILLIF